MAYQHREDGLTGEGCDVRLKAESKDVRAVSLRTADTVVWNKYCQRFTTIRRLKKGAHGGWNHFGQDSQ